MRNDPDPIFYKNYVYRPQLDIEEDNIKIFHSVYAISPDGKQEVDTGWMPLSPYTTAYPTLFQKWIDCGMPNKDTMGLRGNASYKDIEEYYWKWLDDKIDEEILGG